MLAWIADALPLKYFVELADGVYLNREHVWSNLGAIAVVLAWGAGGLAVAFRRFGWEPAGAPKLGELKIAPTSPASSSAAAIRFARPAP